MKINKQKMVFAVLLVAVACTKQENGSNPESDKGTISVTPASQTLDYKSGSVTVSVRANKAWQATASENWITVTPSRGEGNADVTVSVTKNGTGEERRGKVTFGLNMGNASAEVTVTQATNVGPDGIVNATIAEFNAEPDSDKMWYRITGEIISISSYAYGDLYIKDDTGFLYVYGLAPAKGGSTQDFKSLNLKAGDVVTLVGNRTTYGEKKVIETANAYYESHTAGRGYPGFTEKSAKATWLELPATSESADGNVFIHHRDEAGGRNFSAYFSTGDRVSRWVCYPYVYGQGEDGRHNDPYAFDPLVDVGNQATLSKSYKGDFIRGHMVPSNDRAGRANYDVFLATNIMPQDYSLNGGIWSDLEKKVHSKWASQSDTLYVVTGADIAGSTTTETDIDNKTVTVPVGVYKAILAKTKQGEYKALGIYLDNKPNANATVSGSMAISIDELEKKVGTDFFVNLPDDVEKDVEAADPQADNWWWQ
ncbi:MAG: DNA/RNA non-specific endonuclease [Bacteroidia bacterium]|nr:DNA/RNA non-specific endonuclease [Bacteroidia bacterium]